MKKYFILLFSISIGIVTSCQNQKATTKPQKSVEVKVEKNDSVFKIAERELQKKVLPLAVLRKYPDLTVKRINI